MQKALGHKTDLFLEEGSCTVAEKWKTGAMGQANQIYETARKICVVELTWITELLIFKEAEGTG